MIDMEEPKYRKKRDSSVSKSKVKSKHKHRYRPCLLLSAGRPYRAFYCELCGKIKDVKFFEVEPIGHGLLRLLTDNEVSEKYSNLEQVEIPDLNVKYVAVKNRELRD